MRGDLWNQVNDMDPAFLKDNGLDAKEWNKKGTKYTVRDAALYGMLPDRPSTRATTYTYQAHPDLYM
jgi:hypothetical protein